MAAYHRFPGLSTHHVAKAGRVHTATNVLRLCQRCHERAEGNDVPLWLPDGTKWYGPKLTFAHCHWLKIRRTPDEYDADVLRTLRMGHLIPPEPVPFVYQAEYLVRACGRTRDAEIELAKSGFPGTLIDLLLATMQPPARK